MLTKFGNVHSTIGTLSVYREHFYVDIFFIMQLQLQG